MTLGLWIAVGVLTGALGTTGVWVGVERNKASKAGLLDGQAEIIKAVGSVSDQVATGQLDVQKNLTAPDLISVACSKEYLEAKGDLLCREMFCRMQQRGVDSQTGDECEEITNLLNSIEILKNCGQKEEGAYTACIRIFEKRK